MGAHSSRWGPAREKAIIISRAGLLFTLLPHRTNRPPHALKILFCFSCAPRYPTRGRSHPPLTHNRRCTPALHSVKSRWNLRNLLGESTGFGDQRRVLPQMTTSNRHDLPSTVRTGTTRGPGRLTNALRINSRHDGVDLCGGGTLWLGTAARPTAVIGRSVRIGITKETHRLLRFCEQNPFVSGPKQ